MNIIQTVQKNLGFNTLEKINPNTQETVSGDNRIGNNALAQAAIPACLLAIYNRLESDPDISFLDAGQKGNVLENLFGKSAPLVINRISEYSKSKDMHNMQELEHIAIESMRVVKDRLGQQAPERTVRNFVAGQKPEVLLYLPPSLDLGTVLMNNNLDDRTGKMEGPVSSLMHNLEKTFNRTDSL